MKWTYVIRQKLKIALILCVVSVIVISTNLIDKWHFSQIQQSFNSIYKDRLLVEAYIYEISGCLHQKMTLFDNGFKKSDRHVNTQLNDSIENLLVLYGETVLTTSESRFFDELKSTFKQLRKRELAEVAVFANTGRQIIEKKPDIAYGQLNMILNELSEIQKTETKKILEDSNRLIASSGINSQFEIVIIIFIGIICQVLIFASKAVKTNFTQNAMWN